nr:acyltransferase family protein [Demequina silvatica]
MDGLRALAVVLVVAFHLAPASLPGGYVGVDVFFVLSGFLITTILLRERARDGRVSLRRFWTHRARRLLPALALVVVAAVAAVALAGGIAALAGAPLAAGPWGDLLVGIGGQVAGAATFTSNWLLIASGQGYAAAATPHLLENLWSLAVEEQFYLLWPLAVLAVVAFGGTMRRAAWAAAVLALGSGAAMAALVPAGGDPTRVYMGTDTHAFGLMIGAALAFWWARPDSPALAAARRPRAISLGFVGAACLVGIAAFLPWDSAWTYRGGLVLASLATAAIIHMLVAVPALGEVLDARPLRWLGDRSYGIYLWHWPVLVIAVTALDGGRVRDASGLAIAITVVVTLVAAAASYRWIELPVRRVGFRRAARMAWRRRTVAAGGIAAALTAAVVLGMVHAPERTALETQLEEGERIAAQAAAVLPEPAPTPGAVPTPGARASSLLGTEEPALPARVPPPGARPAPVPELPSGRDVTLVGDSVALGAAPALAKALPGVSIDAEVGRQFADGVDRVERLADRGRLRDYVVVALGTNGAVPAGEVDRLLEAAGGRPVVMVTPFGDRTWMRDSQREVRAAVRDHTTVVLADWQSAVLRDPSVLGPDGIHPDAKGMDVFARVVADALTRASVVR